VFIEHAEILPTYALNLKGGMINAEIVMQIFLQLMQKGVVDMLILNYKVYRQRHLCGTQRPHMQIM